MDECSDDELCSDSFPMKLVDGLIWEFKGKQVVRKEGDIVLAGANPSAEGEDVDEGTEEHIERGIDFVLNHRLQVRLLRLMRKCSQLSIGLSSGVVAGPPSGYLMRRLTWERY